MALRLRRRRPPEDPTGTMTVVEHLTELRKRLVISVGSVFLGLVLALPIVLFQVWRFITPGLTERERRYAFPFVASSLVLFTLGGWFALLTLPKGLAFLLGFAGTERVQAVLSIGKYLGFVM